MTEPIGGSMSTATFDAVAYKATTREQWQTAAEPWYRWAPFIEEWLGEATEAMLDMADVGAGARVLDVAAGAGGQTLAAARRVGAAGAVLATDISSSILGYAERAARDAGLRNVAVRVMDGEALEVDGGMFDAVISRVGFIYFPDQEAAFGGCGEHCARQGGWRGSVLDARGEPVLLIPVSIIRWRAGLGRRHRVSRVRSVWAARGDRGSVHQSGVSEVEVRRVSAPLRMASAAECLRFERESFGALHQTLSGLTSPSGRTRGTRSSASSRSSRPPAGSRGPAS